MIGRPVPVASASTHGRRSGCRALTSATTSQKRSQARRRPGGDLCDFAPEFHGVVSKSMPIGRFCARCIEKAIDPCLIVEIQFGGRDIFAIPGVCCRPILRVSGRPDSKRSSKIQMLGRGQPKAGSLLETIDHILRPEIRSRRTTNLWQHNVFLHRVLQFLGDFSRFQEVGNRIWAASRCRDCRNESDAQHVRLILEQLGVRCLGSRQNRLNLQRERCLQSL